MVLRQAALAVEAVEEARQRLGVAGIADRVAAGVGADPAHQPAVGVAQRAEVELLDPAAGVVHARALVEHEGAEALGVVRAEAAAAAHRGEGARGLAALAGQGREAAPGRGR